MFIVADLVSLKHSDVVFILLINVKMPTIEKNKFHAQLSEHEKCFITPRPFFVVYDYIIIHLLDMIHATP